MHLPDLHDVPDTLSWCLYMHFNTTNLDDDYDDTITILDKIITSHSADNLDLHSRVQDAASLAAMLVYGHFIYYQKLDYLEEAIFCLRVHLSTIPLEHPDHHTIIQDLTKLERKCFNEFGVQNTDLEVHSCDAEVIDLPSFSNLAASLINSSAVNLTSED